MLMRCAMFGSVSFRRLDDLGQHAARRLRVDERHARVADAHAGRLVDEPQAAVAQVREGRLDVGDAVGDVVQPRPAAGEEAADRRVGLQRRQQLDVAGTDVEQDRLDALLLDDLAMRERHAVGPLVQRDGGVEVVDGDADVVDLGEHAAPESRWPRPGSARGRPLAGAHGGGDADLADRLRLAVGRAAGHDRVDLAAVEDLVGEQLPGEALEQVAVLLDEAPRRAVRLEGELALLLVADAAREVGERIGVDRRRLRRLAGAHRVVVDHRAGDLGDALEVVGRAGRDLAEDDLLRDAAAEQHRHLVDELVARLQVGVLVGQVDDVAERAAARDDGDLVDAVDAAEQLAADGVAGLVVGDDATLAVVQRGRGLHAGDDALDGVVEVVAGDRVAAAAGAEDRRLVADVGEVGAGEAARLLGDEVEVGVLAQRFVARVDVEDPPAAPDVGRRDVDLAVEAARAQERRVELLEQVGGGHDDEPAARREAVHLDEELVERLLALGVLVRAAPRADRVELVDEDDRRLVLARLVEQAPDARGAEAGEHLDERGRRLREELRAGLVGDRLREQRLARAGRAVEQHALRDGRAEALERLGVAQELDDLAQLGLGLVDAGDVVPADLLAGLRLDLDRLRARHHLQRAPQHVDDGAHEDEAGDAAPVGGELLDPLGDAGKRRRCDGHLRTIGAGRRWLQSPAGGPGRAGRSAPTDGAARGRGEPRASLTFWTSTCSRWASSVANRSRACVATVLNAASSWAVVTPSADASFWRTSPRASRRSRRVPRSGRRSRSAERTFAASTPVADAMSSTSVSRSAPRLRSRRSRLRLPRSARRSWRALSRPAWTFARSTPSAFASAAAKSSRKRRSRAGRSGSTEFRALVTWSTGLPSAVASAWIASVRRCRGVLAWRIDLSASRRAVGDTPIFRARASRPKSRAPRRRPRTVRGPWRSETPVAPAPLGADADALAPAATAPPPPDWLPRAYAPEASTTPASRMMASCLVRVFMAEQDARAD